MLKLPCLNSEDVPNTDTVILNDTMQALGLNQHITYKPGCSDYCYIHIVVIVIIFFTLYQQPLSFIHIHHIFAQGSLVFKAGYYYCGFMGIFVAFRKVFLCIFTVFKQFSWQNTPALQSSLLSPTLASGLEAL